MSDLRALPDGLPWTVEQAFLLLDGAVLSDLPQRLKQISPAVSPLALYDQPPFSALREVSPLLVALAPSDTALLNFHLQHAEDECGVLMFSGAPAHAVAEHWRKLLTVELPTGAPALLRLADAAVAQALFASAQPSLFGPLTCVVTADRVPAVWHVHRSRQAECPPLCPPYRLSAEQSAALDQVDRRRMLLDLDAHLLRYFRDFHRGETLSQRWPMLEDIEARASALHLSCQAELFNYANLTALLDGSAIEQHPHIQQLLHSPSLQPAGERVALAVDLAERWARQRNKP